MLHIFLASTWANGVMNGYLHKEKGLPNSYKYTIMSITTGVYIMKTLGSQSLPITKPIVMLSGIFVGIPVVIGSVFCTGNMMGKSIRYMKEYRYIC